jgi:coniferyl-aldehyde dehydrogenase
MNFYLRAGARRHGSWPLVRVSFPSCHRKKTGFKRGDMTTPDKTRMHVLFDVQYKVGRAQIEVRLAQRQSRLLTMKALLDDHGTALAQAVQKDFGVQSLQLTEIADLFVRRTVLSHTLMSLPKWIQPQKVSTLLSLQRASAYLQHQRLGMAGVVSPWHYPVQLALGPVVTVLAAGNRVMLKPSEWTPHTSALMAELMDRAFAPDELCVVLGDAELAAEFSSLPFDHLFFAGSTAVGRIVAKAATKLTLTSLELGGKSPCIIDASCDLDAAAIKMSHGKLLNAGQTCIAPDDVLLPKGKQAAFGHAFAQAVPCHRRQPRLRRHHQPTPSANAITNACRRCWPQLSQPGRVFKVDDAKASAGAIEVGTREPVLSALR